MRTYLVLPLLLVVGCAPTRVSMRQVQEYDNFVQMAEKRGMATPEMYHNLGMLMTAYARHPGEDPQDRYARQMAAAQTMMMLDSGTVYPTSRPMPMSPLEYRKAVHGY